MSSSDKGQFIQLLAVLLEDLQRGRLIESDIPFYSFLSRISPGSKIVNKSIESLSQEYIIDNKPKSLRSIYGHLRRLKSAGHLTKCGNNLQLATFVKNKNEYVIKGEKFNRE